MVRQRKITQPRGAHRQSEDPRRVSKRAVTRKAAFKDSGGKKTSRLGRSFTPPTHHLAQDGAPGKAPGEALVQITSGSPLSPVERVIERLRKDGHRITSLRRFLLEKLQGSHGPLSVAELLQISSKAGLNPNKTTIYRELYFLVQNGIVSELDLLDGMKRYEFIAHDGHHHHMVCTRCGHVECVHVCFDTSAVLSEIAKQSRFQVQHHVLEFFGLCENCRGK